ncbi:selenium cofactor biosynthesis protein YqeC [Desulfoscipio gibsoniae]|nr:selenium cofactor biosynthesis protein YqeC [Desulfoscipio gibsoniae]
MKLIDAFQIKKGDVIALVGGGGKTSAMFAIGNEALNIGYKVVLTTTTRIYVPAPASGVNVVLKPDELELLRGIEKKIKTCSMVVAGAGFTQENKVIGIDPDLIGQILQAGADLVLVEADGAARKPFKAPRQGEPVIPGLSTLVIPVVGVDCLYKPLVKEYIHRPEVVSRLLGVEEGEPVTPSMVAGILLHPLGYRKDVPRNSRWVPLINKVHSPEELKNAREVAFSLCKGGAGRVVISALNETVPVREVLVFDLCSDTGRRHLIPPGNA